jgi:HK97 family phage portal protein
MFEFVKGLFLGKEVKIEEKAETLLLQNEEKALDFEDSSPIDDVHYNFTFSNKGNYLSSNPETYNFGSHTTYLCARANAENVASINLKTMVMKKGSWVEEESNPVQKLIDAPNDEDTFQSFMETVVWSLMLSGIAYVVKFRFNNEVVQLHCIKPSAIKVVNDGFAVKGYEVKIANKLFEIPKNDIICIKFTNPKDRFSGLSPLKAAQLLVATEEKSVEWNVSSFDNRAMSDYILSMRSDLNEKQWKAARRSFREQAQGTVNAWNPVIMRGDISVHNLSRNPAEMDFINGRKLTREEICAIFKVPAPIAGYAQDSKFSNFEMDLKTYIQLTIIPLSKKIAAIFTNSLMKDFGEFYFELDTSGFSILSQIEESAIKIAKELFSMGVPFAIINKRLNLGVDSFPGDNVSYISGVPAMDQNDEEFFNNSKNVSFEKGFDAFDKIKKGLSDG